MKQNLVAYAKECEELEKLDFTKLQTAEGYLQQATLGGFLAAIKKLRLKALQQFMMGIIGGLIIGFGVTCCLAAILALPTKYQSGFGMLFFAIIFAACMVLIIFAGGGLFTSHVVATIPALKKIIHPSDYFKGIFLVLLGNAMGTLFFTILIYAAGLSQLKIGVDQQQTILEKAYEVAMAKMFFAYDKASGSFLVTTKTITLVIVTAFTSGFLCNIMVSSTVFLSNASNKGTIILFVSFLPFFFFSFIGFQQAPTNTLFIWIMLFENIFHLSNTINVENGAQWLQFVIFIFLCWLAALLGNWCSGSFVWSGIMYLANQELVKLLFAQQRLVYLKSILNLKAGKE